MAYPEQATPQPTKYSMFTKWLGVIVALLLIANALILAQNHYSEPVKVIKSRQLSNNPIWAPIVDDDDPIMIVVGDYYVFGERGLNVKPDRLVREYHINSHEELNQELENVEVNGDPLNYYDLKLTYLPLATPFALKDIKGETFRILA